MLSRRSEKLEKVVTVSFKNSLCTEGGDRIQGSVVPRFAGSLPSPVPEILEFRALRDSGRYA